MHYSDGDATEDMIGFMENSELPQDKSPIVVYFLAGEQVRFIECKDGTEREIDLCPCCRQAAPGAELPSRDNGFQDDRLCALIMRRDINVEIRESEQQFLIESKDLLVADIAGFPWLIRTASAFLQ
jgi:hypothetical protein